jgi:hypothetical protein
MPGCRSSRRAGFSTISPLRGRPRPRRLFGCLGLAAGGGRSRARIAVPSRAMWPIRQPPSRASTSAACARSGNAPAANSAKARLNVASLGT